jgi:hypothetical protein
MSILTPEDHTFFQENGYLRVRNVVPQENCDAAITMIWDYLGMDPNRPEDWYRDPLPKGGMIEIYQHQAMWNNRQHPRMHQVYAELMGTEKLWVSMDRVNMKPPQHPDHPEYDHKGFIHWDVDTSSLSDRQRLGVQGVLYLADTDEDMGGFQCVPGFHRCLEEWIETQPSDRNPRVPDLKSLPAGMQVTPIPGKAGDLVIWNRFLAHGNGRNLGSKPRFAQYISMRPAREDNEEERMERVACWRERRPPTAPYFFGDPREPEFSALAELTPLGRKILGMDRWDAPV